MSFLLHYIPQRTPAVGYHVSLNQNTSWNTATGRVPWSTDPNPIAVPIPNAGPGFTDAGGRFWLYAGYYTFSGFTLVSVRAAYWDAPTQTAIPVWTVTGAPLGTGGIVSAVPDGSTGLYAVVPGNYNWVARYTGSGTTATATTTSDPTWQHAWDQGTAPTLPYYANGQLWAIWYQGTTLYGLVMGEYNASWTAGGHVFVASLWTAGSADPTNAGNWSFVQYLAHDTLATGPHYADNLHEDRLPWVMPVALGTDVYFPTGMDLITGSGLALPADRTVVWRMDSSGTVTSDLQVPQPATDFETFGGPLGVYGGELYWAQFTTDRVPSVSTSTAVITLWRRHSGAWSAISTYSRALSTYNTPLIATLFATPTGLWLLMDQQNAFYGHNTTTTELIAWDAGSNTWSIGPALTGGPGDNDTPRIWS